MDSCDRHCTVLIVDTAPEKVRQLLATLQKEYEVTVATCGQKGVENGLNVPSDTTRFTVMMPEPGEGEVSVHLKSAPMAHGGASTGMAGGQQHTRVRIRHELANANHGMLLGLQLLSRYWEDLESCLDEFDNGFDDPQSDTDNCLVARKNGPVVIAGIVEAARKMEVLLTCFKEGEGEAVVSVVKSVAPAGEE